MPQLLGEGTPLLHLRERLVHIAQIPERRRQHCTVQDLSVDVRGKGCRALGLTNGARHAVLEMRAGRGKCSQGEHGMAERVMGIRHELGVLHP